jgi:hypothetical protein
MRRATSKHPIVRLRLLDGDLYVCNGVEVTSTAIPDETRWPIATTLELARRVVLVTNAPLDRCEAALRVPTAALERLFAEEVRSTHAHNLRRVARELAPELKRDVRAATHGTSLRALLFVVGAGPDPEAQRARWNDVQFHGGCVPPARKRSLSAAL